MNDTLGQNEIEMLRDIKATHGGWRPWNGFAGRAERLAKRGLLVKAGITAMPPHVCYVITEAGEKALAEITG